MREVSDYGPLADRHSPVTGRPPSYLGGSQTRMAQSSPTDVTRTASGGSGTSGQVGGSGRMVRGPLAALGDHPLAQPPGSPALTHNLQGDGGHILARGIGHLDGVATLVASFRALDHEAVNVASLLNADPALGAREHLNTSTGWPPSASLQTQTSLCLCAAQQSPGVPHGPSRRGPGGYTPSLLTTPSALLTLQQTAPFIKHTRPSHPQDVTKLTPGACNALTHFSTAISLYLLYPVISVPIVSQKKSPLLGITLGYHQERVAPAPESSQFLVPPFISAPVTLDCDSWGTGLPLSTSEAPGRQGLHMIPGCILCLSREPSIEGTSGRGGLGGLLC